MARNMLRSGRGVFVGLAVVGLSPLVASAGTKYSIEVQNVQQQTAGSTIVAGFGALSYNQYSLVAKIDTGGASLSAAPILQLPAGTVSPVYPSGQITFPVGPGNSPTWPGAAGYNRYQYGNAWTSTAQLASNAGSGAFTFILGDATAGPSLNLDTANPALPVVPRITGGGTWSGSTLLVDPTVTTMLTINSAEFTNYTTWPNGAAINISVFGASAYPTPLMPQVSSQYGQGKTDPALTSLVISAGTLQAGQDYLLQLNYTELNEIISTPFTGTGISGTPQGMSYDTSTTFVEVHAVPEPTGVALLVVVMSLLASRRRSAAGA